MAKFEKGHAKLGGRKKGVPNKARIKKVAEVLAENNVDCVAAVLDLLAHGEMKDADRARLYLELHSYCEVKPKEIEPENPDGDGGDGDKPITSADILQIVKGPSVS